MTKKHYYFIGIGGIGMSGLAHILIKRGHIVSGSDPAINKQTEDLLALGATIHTDQVAQNITDAIDIVVVTSAIKKDNPELLEARRLHLTILDRPVVLNQIINEHKSIAITGTHGKTTASSMLALALTKAGLDPTAIIGAEVHTIEGNAKEGKGEYSVAEVCEYERAFLDIYPFGAVITNIEADHLDVYKDIHDIVEAFSEFVGHIDKDGFLVYCGDDENATKAAKHYAGKKVSYGFGEDNTYVAAHVVVPDHFSHFSVSKSGTVITEANLLIPGNHNILNALSVIAVADTLGIDLAPICTALGEFKGADRRFQVKAEIDGITIIDDYAHHPTEVAATLKGARQFYPDSRLIAVFQPHQHSRTKLLLNDFANSFDSADITLIPEIYAVRDSEEDIKSVSSQDLVDLINEKDGKAKYFSDFNSCLEELKSIVKSGDVVITIGAGPVYKIGEELSTHYTQSNH